MGCDGCELWNRALGVLICYAGILHLTRGKTNTGFAPDFDQPTVFAGRMAKAARWSDLTATARVDKPWLNGMPRLVFVSDMGDSLSNIVTFEYLLQEVINIAMSDRGRRHVWQWLTKRPTRMAEFSAWLQAQGIAWPSNVWVGTSLTTQATTNRISALLRVGNDETTRFLSVEPQVEQIDLVQWLTHLDWIIQGGESGSDARAFDLSWARVLRDACRAARKPYFLKQLGANVWNAGRQVRLRDSHGGDWSEWPADLRVREMPPAKKEVR
jgi:protein gp37